MSNAETVDKKGLWNVIFASSVGTLIEWYDFYIFGSLAIVISTQFFPKDNPTAAFLSTLATFAAGFVVRPFGALFFGRLGDLIGRKYTFMVTLILMGLSTFLIGCIPGYETIGFLAPILVLILRLLQGLALGGEYGGAATYVAEHAPKGERGYWTSWIQTTATVGLFVSLLVILLTKKAFGDEAFNSWAWRVPFWISIVMVAVSYIIRKNMKESPLFAKVKSEGKASTNPLKESFGHRFNLKFVLLALFGATMGQGVVWYTGQFYAMSFIQKVCNVDFEQSNYIIAVALALGTILFILFGWLSDKIGRKAIMMVGMLIAILAYRPIYRAMYNATDLSQKQEITEQTLVNTEAKLAKNGVDSVYTTTTNKAFTDGTTYKEVKVVTVSPNQAANSPAPTVTKTTKLSNADFWFLIMMVFIQLVFVTMVYGPIAAFLVEMFPTKIRYTSMSLPYHIGNGVFGGLLPAVATYLATNANLAGAKESYLEGLWYPIVIAGVCFLIGTIYIDGKDMDIDD